MIRLAFVLLGFCSLFSRCGAVSFDGNAATRLSAHRTLDTTTNGQQELATTRLNHQLNSTTLAAHGVPPPWHANVPFALCQCWRWHDPASQDHQHFVSDETSLGFAEIKVGARSSFKVRRFHLSSCGTGANANADGVMDLIIFDSKHTAAKDRGKTVQAQLAPEAIKAVVAVNVSIAAAVTITAGPDSMSRIFEIKGKLMKANDDVKLDNGNKAIVNGVLAPNQDITITMKVKHNDYFEGGAQGRTVKYHHDYAGQCSACIKFALAKSAPAIAVGKIPQGGLKVQFINTNQGNKNFNQTHEEYLKLMFANHNLNTRTHHQQIENPYAGGRTAPHIIVFAQQEARFKDGNHMLACKMQYHHFFQRGYVIAGRDYWSGFTKPGLSSQMGTAVLIHESIGHNLRPYEISRQQTKGSFGLKGASTIHLKYKGLDGQTGQFGTLLLGGVHMETGRAAQREQWNTITEGKFTGEHPAAVGMWVGDFNIRIRSRQVQRVDGRPNPAANNLDNVATVSQELVGATRAQTFLARNQDEFIATYNAMRRGADAHGPQERYEGNVVPANAFWSYTLANGPRQRGQSNTEKCGFLMNHHINQYAPVIPAANAVPDKERYYSELRGWRGSDNNTPVTQAQIKECYFEGKRDDQVRWRKEFNEIDGGWLDRLAWKVRPNLIPDHNPRLQVTQHVAYDKWGIFMKGFDHALVMIGINIEEGAGYMH